MIIYGKALATVVPDKVSVAVTKVQLNIPIFSMLREDLLESLTDP